MRHPRRRGTFLLLPALALASGCGSSLPTSADDAAPPPLPVPYLVRDVREAAGGYATIGSGVALGSTLLLSVRASVFSSWTGLWRSDGTSAGTERIQTTTGGIAELALHDGAVFFTVFNTDDVWRTDGTAAGTAVMTRFPPYPATSSVHRLTAAGGSLYWVVRSGRNVPRPDVLWRSDGTPEGTLAVKEFRLALDAGVAQTPVTAGIERRLVFVADDGVHGGEPWSTDGSLEGTVLLNDIVRGANADGPEALVALENAALFFPRLPDNRMELWRTDGTPGGTALVRALGPRSEIRPCVAARRLFFAGNDGIHGEELWVSDGSAAGTRMVKDIHPSGSSFPLALTTVGDTVYFVANDGTHGAELWRSDGTFTGTRLVKDIEPGSRDSMPVSLFDGNGRLFFLVADAAHGQELWTSDGTSAGTQLVMDIVPGPEPSNIRWLTVAGDLAYFSVTRRATQGTNELWAMAVAR